MGLFKDFKDDFSQAVNEMTPAEAEKKAGEKAKTIELDVVNKPATENTTVENELSKLDGLLEKVNDSKMAQSVQQKPARPVSQPTQNAADVFVKREERAVTNHIEESRIMANATNDFNQINPSEASEETSVITVGTTLTGDIQTTGSLDIQGAINGNVACNGKLNVTGMITGNSNSAEFFSDAAKIEGEIVSTGTVKIGAGSVIIGNISATSAVIAGAVKGDIDVKGPVVVDTSAVVMGNIKSRSVQINNGAVIEGFCSQAYAEIDVQGLFTEN
ncbi:Polymer-forming protein [Lachnospiraceae bacterium C7]|nr:Polymer-forming protein [Lachnospiraceae bacterium C7]